MGNNLTQEGLMETLKTMGIRKQKEREPTIKEVNSDWNKLAGALRGVK